jgi:hypothetical protein
MSRITGIGSMRGILTFRNVSAGGGDVTPNAVNWGDLTADENSGSCGFESKQITGIDGSINITANWTASGGGNIGFYYRVDNTQPSIGYPQLTGFTSQTTSGVSVSVSNNQWLTYMYCGEVSGITVTVRNASDSNTVLDTFVCNYTPGGCLLTTAMVGYFNLADDGPELTAMRSLRNHYSVIGDYGEIIQDYYDNSPNIITAIMGSNNEAVEYPYIHNTVLAVKQHVDLGEWQQAHDLYMAMYADLKTRYLGI